MLIQEIVLSWLALRAAAVFAVAMISATVVTWFAMKRSDPETQVTLVQMSEPVFFRKNNGADGEYLQIDSQVAAGTLVVEREGSRAKFACADGSTFELSGGSELTLGEGQGKQLFLRPEPSITGRSDALRRS
jgi:hypothetical protein